MFIVFLGLLAVVHAQDLGTCSLAESHFTSNYATNDGDSMSGKAFEITFGADIQLSMGVVEVTTEGSVAYFNTWVDDRKGAIAMMSHSVVGSTACANSQGNYAITWTTCDAFTLAVVEDACTERASRYKDITFQRSTVAKAGCLDAGSTLAGDYNKVAGTVGEFSEEAFTIVIAQHGYAIESSKFGVLFSLFSHNHLNTLIITYLGTSNSGHLCDDATKTGVYALTFQDNTCAATLCAIQDDCVHRDALLNGVQLNGATGDCQLVSLQDWSGECNAQGSGGVFAEGPQACIDQHGGDKCIYCEARIQDDHHSFCFDRLENDCEAIRQSDARDTFCGMNFVCPAGTIGVSVLLLFSLLFAFISL